MMTDEITKERKRIQRRMAIREIMNGRNCNRKEANMLLENAKEKYNIGFIKYCKNRLYLLPEQENLNEIADKVAAERKASMEARKNKAQEEDEILNANFIKKISEEMGWSEDKAKEIVSEGCERVGISVANFYFYKLYQLPPKKQSAYMNTRTAVALSKKFDLNKFFKGILMDKARTNAFFKECISRPWCINSIVTLDEFKNIFKNENKLFYKPLSDHLGNGALPIDLSKEGIENAYEMVKNLPIGVVEGYIKQHDNLKKLSPNAVCSLRVVSIYSPFTPVIKNDNFAIVYTSLKMGGPTSHVDNLANGGMVAAVNQRTGRICTYAADEQDQVYSRHPISGVKIKGFQVPYYNEALDLVRKLCEKHKIEGYLGWDIAITNDGPELVETNTRPGTILYQLPFISKRKGKNHLLAKFL